MLRRLGMALAMLAGVLLLAALGAFGYAQTRIGQTQLASLASRQLSTPERQVERLAERLLVGARRSGRWSWQA